MKITNIITILLITFCLASPRVNAFCGVGGIFGMPPSTSCSCSLNKVAIKKMSGNNCLESRCISQGALQHYLNLGWIPGCCSSQRVGKDEDQAQLHPVIYPNPATTSAIVTLTFEDEQPVQLNLIDMQGNLVTAFSTNSITRGTHEIKFDTSALSNGIYLMQLQSGDQIQSEKLVIAK